MGHAETNDDTAADDTGLDDTAADDTGLDDIITRVRLDELSGEVVITRWRGDLMISERREPARED